MKRAAEQSAIIRQDPRAWEDVVSDIEHHNDQEGFLLLKRVRENSATSNRDLPFKLSKAYSRLADAVVIRSAEATVHVSTEGSESRKDFADWLQLISDRVTESIRNAPTKPEPDEPGVGVVLSEHQGEQV